MSWNDLVLYLKEPKSALGSHQQQQQHSYGGGADEEEEIFSDLSSGSLSGDSIEDRCLSKTSTPLRRKRSFNRLISSMLSYQQNHQQQVGYSVECLNNVDNNSFHSNAKISRSSSIRIGDSPLHRGAQLGSPAFRRKKMRAAKSEIQISEMGSMANHRLSSCSPSRKSNLPLPASSSSPSTRTGLQMRNKNIPLKENNNKSSPRNSIYKEALKQQQIHQTNVNKKPNNTTKVLSPTTRSKSTMVSADLSNSSTTTPNRPLTSINNNSIENNSKSKAHNNSGNKSRIPITPVKFTTNSTTTKISSPSTNRKSANNDLKTNNKTKFITNQPKTSTLKRQLPSSKTDNNFPNRNSRFLNKSTPSLVSSNLNTTSSTSIASSSSNSTVTSATKSSTLRSYPPRLSRPNHLRSKGVVDPLSPLAPTAKFRSDGEISICEDKSATVDERFKAVHSSHANTLATTKTHLNNASMNVAKKHASTSINNNNNNSVSSSRVLGRRREQLAKNRAATSVALQTVNHNLPSPTSGCWPRSVSPFSPNKSPLDNSLSSRSTTLNSSTPSTNDSCSSKLQRKNSFFKVRSRSLTIFQRLDGLRRSLSSSRGGGGGGGSGSGGIRNSQEEYNKPPSQRYANYEQQDWVFFRGFSGKRREDLEEPSSSYSVSSENHTQLLSSDNNNNKSSQLIVKTSSEFHRRSEHVPGYRLRRVMSFHNAQDIAQALYEGNFSLLNQLYGDFPRTCVDESSSRPWLWRKDISNKLNSMNSYEKEGVIIRRDSSRYYQQPHNFEQQFLGQLKTSSSTTFLPSSNNNRQCLAAGSAKSSTSSSSHNTNPCRKSDLLNSSNNNSSTTNFHRSIRSNVRSLDNNNSVTFSTSVMFVKQPSDLQSDSTTAISTSSSNSSSCCRPVLSTTEESRHSNNRVKTTVNLETTYGTPTMHGTNSRLESTKEPSPVISPWNHNRYLRPGSMSSNSSSSSGVQSSNEVDVDACAEGQFNLHHTMSNSSHPFAKRTQMHYAQRQEYMENQRLKKPYYPPHQSRTMLPSSCNDVTISTSRHGCGVTLSPNTFSPTNELQISVHNGYESAKTAIRKFSNSSSTSRIPSNNNHSLEKIMSNADNSLTKAESILSSLRIESNEISLSKKEPIDCGSDSSEEANSLGSDIETNIRRLEKTQAKINAALETFRSVQAMSGNKKHRSLPHSNSAHSLMAHLTQPHTSASENKSSTAPAKLGTNSVTDNDELNNKIILHNSGVGCETPKNAIRSRKQSLFRRHSFTSSKEKSPAIQQQDQHSHIQQPSSTILPTDSSTNSTWIDSYNDSSNLLHNYDDGGSFSDSEGGFMPLKNRLRGLLGSFGRGKKRLNRPIIVTKKKDVLGQSTNSVNDESLRNSSIENSLDKNGILKATLGEFTRQIEMLSTKTANDYDEFLHTSNNLSIQRKFNPLRKTLSNPPEDRVSGHTAKNVILRNKRELTKQHSQDAPSVSSSNYNYSNRNSVISGQSISSESYENEDHSVSEDEIQEEHTSNSSPTNAEHQQLTPQQRHDKKVFYIAREILTSERVFVDILRLLNVEFREFIQKARKESKHGIMPDSDFSRIFSNLPELQALNEDLLQDFEERIANWDHIKKIADVIVRKGPFLKLYTTYIREFSNVNYHFDECCQKYTKFAKLVAEFEKKERCRLLKIKHFMLKPVQRLPQYKLLLEDYLKHLDPNSPDFDDTTNALRIVSDAADHANDTIKQGDQFRRMLRLQSRLGDMELIRPGRELIREGELQKISRKGIGPRYFVLLSDCLLYCTYSGGHWSGENTHLRVSYKIPLNTLQVRVPNAEEYQNEFNITSPIRSCTLQAVSVNERNEWIEDLNSAIEEHINRKATFSVASNGVENSTPAEACKIGNIAPVWIPDRRVTMCQTCGVDFSVLIRRHHCRACGKVVCSTCSSNKAPLRYREFEAARVCDSCYEFLEQELSNFDNLKSRFKKRDVGKSNHRHIPQKLKVNANGEGAQMCGYLRKRQKNGKWKRMWFVLKDKVIYSYKASEDTIAVETFAILGYSLEKHLNNHEEIYENEISLGLTFSLSHPGSDSLVFAVENEQIGEKWMLSIKEAIKTSNI